VEIEVEKTREGLKITRFETRILDKKGDSLKGLDGLAMLLVDVDYNGEVFDMGMTVFAKDIGDDGVIKMTGLPKSVAVIAIDKHGNESKAFITAQVQRSALPLTAEAASLIKKVTLALRSHIRGFHGSRLD